jgi:hypothetical protein
MEKFAVPMLAKSYLQVDSDSCDPIMVSADNSQEIQIASYHFSERVTAKLLQNASSFFISSKLLQNISLFLSTS